MSSKKDNALLSQRSKVKQSCPECQQQGRKGVLEPRRGKHGPFLICSECDFLKPLGNHDGHVVKALGVACPQCQAELVLRQGRYGMFIGCSDYPQCQHIESVEKPEPDLTCHSHLCPECGLGQIVERKSRFGKVFYACDSFPQCKFTLNLSPISGECEQCQFPLLVERKSATGSKLQCANRKCNAVQKVS
ncbi:type I DNA topoisomerase [Vibrio caribbeanicus]|uniref:DNA topoisomerase I-related protein n=1 Tax=Vibrio caribbeanicus ATCC BAA-2122 TaxID=796620 RepID=E3BIK8_9VIBR|nr:type I DNA topoisomerase [Vibrio caribbeanicus]EFP97117.1 DNA topoisomerase I-related protein [Vibrio caribbeanicus ATCC BAA-2122]